MNDLDVPASAIASRAPVDRYARWTGVAAGALAACWLSTIDHGDGVLYAIPAFGLCAVAGVLAGEAVTAPARGTVRTAGLAPRRVRDHVPSRLTLLLIVLAAFLVVLLAVAGAVSSADDLGRAGRQLTLTCNGMTEAHGPWPGLYYGLPMLASLTVATGACGWSLRRIADRPGDDQSRRDRSLAIVAAWGIVVSTSLLGAAVTASASLLSLTCDGTLGTVSTVIPVPLALVSLTTAAWLLFTVCSPRAGQRPPAARESRR
ncbi:hypothetical protein [Streptomyces sp. NPDC096032]|uniref:hypothetical protein n=1 Tax=Streptomyces sp. NPDC096032 TaxID=3366070 RepID=UPI0037F5E144